MLNVSGNNSRRIPEHEIMYKQLIAGINLWRFFISNIRNIGTVSYSCDLLFEKKNDKIDYYFM